MRGNIPASVNKVNIWTYRVSEYLCDGAILVYGFRVNLPGSTGSVCYTAVESLDLGCLLRWDCPHVSPNTTFTVQTKTQG